MTRHQRLGRATGLAASLVVYGLLTTCTADAHPRPAVRPQTQPPSRLVEVGGALRGLKIWGAPPAAAERKRLIEAADLVVDRSPSATETLEVSETSGAFVGDAQAAWTLALAGWIAGDERYRSAAARMVDAWVATTTRLAGACPDSGACSTSLMVSRAAPGLVFAVDVLRADDGYGERQHERFQRWLRAVILPAVSERDNNWGDAGTFLRAVVGAELDDQEELDAAANRWRERIDLIEPDGRIPEEIRRGDASLMYSQEALAYKVATADVLDRAGIDVWATKGKRGGTLETALALVAEGLARPEQWPGGEGDLRVPKPAGLWLIVTSRWDRPPFARLAAEALQRDGSGHSAILWTGVTHPLVR